MSWGTEARGNVVEVAEQVENAIRSSAAYDPTLALKADDVSSATVTLIEAAASDLPEDKELLVSTHGHLDHNGMSSYGLNVSFVDPEPAPEAAEATSDSTVE